MPGTALTSTVDLEQLTGDFAASVSERPKGAFDSALQQALAHTIEAKVQAQLSVVLEGIGDAFYSLDTQWRFSYINRAAESYFGVPRHDLLRKMIWDVFPESEGTDLRRRYEEVFATGQPLSFESEAVGRQGHYLEFHVFPYNGGLGVSFRDWTDRRRAEEELRESQARLSSLTDNAPACMFYQLNDAADYKDRKLLYISKTCEQVNGIPAEKVQADLSLLYELVLPQYRERMLAKEVEAVREHKAFDMEFEMRHGKTGEIRWHRLIVTPRQLPNGSHVWDGLQIDITDHKRAEEEMRERQAQISALADNLPLGMVYQMDNGVGYEGRRFIYVSASCERLNGIPADMVPKDQSLLFNLILPEFREPVYRAQVEAHAQLKPLDLEFAIRHAKTGEIRWQRIVDAPRKLPNGNIVWDGIQLDITDQKRAEEHQRLLLNELNHRVKNTLATVQSLAAQSFRSIGAQSIEVLPAACASFEARLFALARAHDVLTRENWEGADFSDVLAEACTPYRTNEAECRRIEIEGPDLRVSPSIALSFSMVLHELFTNALKYGALRNASGGVRISWSIIAGSPGSRLSMRWEERGGPPVEPPSRKGFGSRLIQDGLARELNGTVVLNYDPDGVICTVDVPLS